MLHLNPNVPTKYTVNQGLPEFWVWPVYWHWGQTPEFRAEAQAMKRAGMNKELNERPIPLGWHYRYVPSDDEMARLDTPVLRNNPHLRNSLGFLMYEFELRNSSINYTSIEEFYRETDAAVATKRARRVRKNNVAREEEEMENFATENGRTENENVARQAEAKVAPDAATPDETPFSRASWTRVGDETAREENVARAEDESSAVVARSPDRATGPTEGLQRPAESGDLRSDPVAGSGDPATTETAREENVARAEDESSPQGQNAGLRPTAKRGKDSAPDAESVAQTVEENVARASEENVAQAQPNREKRKARCTKRQASERRAELREMLREETPLKVIYKEFGAKHGLSKRSVQREIQIIKNNDAKKGCKMDYVAQLVHQKEQRELCIGELRGAAKQALAAGDLKTYSNLMRTTHMYMKERDGMSASIVEHRVAVKRDASPDREQAQHEREHFIHMPFNEFQERMAHMRNRVWQEFISIMYLSQEQHLDRMLMDFYNQGLHKGPKLGEVPNPGQPKKETVPDGFVATSHRYGNIRTLKPTWASKDGSQAPDLLTQVPGKPDEFVRGW